MGGGMPQLLSHRLHHIKDDSPVQESTLSRRTARGYYLSNLHENPVSAISLDLSRPQALSSSVSI